jgi:nucleoid-associated protein YgaU
MSRYGGTKTIIKKNKPSKKSTTIYRKIPKNDNDVYVMAQEGDRFDQLSFQYYGTPIYWWYIAKANNMKFNNIENGDIIRIPVSIEHAKGS